MPRKNAVQHGTPQGYRKHLKSADWGDPCDDCRRAHNAEMSQYRKSAGRDRSADTMRTTARRRGLNRLAMENPKRANQLIAEEMAKLELEASR